MGKNTIFSAITSLFCLHLAAQTLMPWPVDFTVGGAGYPLPTAGGMNLPQFSEADLDQDGTTDLFVFDRDGNAMNAFRRTASGWQNAPELLAGFPRLNDWALLYDYNQDGAPDIFSYTSEPGIAGVEVHKGKWQNGHLAFDKLSFNQASDILYYEGAGGTPVNLYVSKIDLPALADVDGDGDMDILTFAPNGGYVEYFRNFSEETGHGADTLLFQKADNCWGKFLESGTGKAITLSSDPAQCAQPLHGGPATTSRHIGSTVLALDTDEDGDQDLILGDVSYDNVVWLHNGGTPQQAFMTAQDTSFPQSHPVMVPVFPAGFAADLDDDGDKDLVFVPNAKGTSDLHNVWRYDRSASGTYLFVQDDFLAGEMPDLGTDAFPAFADLNGDGLVDLVIGNGKRYGTTNGEGSRLTLWYNTGTLQQPVFELADTNFLNIPGQFPDLWELAPAFGDLDGDGDLDLMVGEHTGGLIYFENTAPSGSPADFALGVYPFHDIDVGLAARPALADVDDDGLTDLVIGERNGNLNFLKNIGTAGAPDFNSDHQSAPNDPFWGSVDVRELGHVTGYSAPALWKADGQWQLLVGSESGRLHRYSDIEGNFSGMFSQLTDDYGHLRDGGKLSPALYDVNGDGKMELIAGNSRGGITAYKTDLQAPVANRKLSEWRPVVVLPNPARVEAWILSPPGEIIQTVALYDAYGRVVWYGCAARIPVADLPAGIFVVRVRTNVHNYMMKLIKN